MLQTIDYLLISRYSAHTILCYIRQNTPFNKTYKIIQIDSLSVVSTAAPPEPIYSHSYCTRRYPHHRQYKHHPYLNYSSRRGYINHNNTHITQQLYFMHNSFNYKPMHYYAKPGRISEISRQRPTLHNKYYQIYYTNRRGYIKQ
jgi:hypothetical protein